MPNAVKVVRIPMGSNDETIEHTIQGCVSYVWSNHIQQDSVRDIGYSHSITVVGDKLLVSVLVNWCW